MAEPSRPGQDASAARQAKEVAWKVLADLTRPHSAFAGLAAEGLQHLIELRLDAEAQRSGLDRTLLGETFDHALRDFTGAGRPPRRPAAADNDGPPESITDL